MAAAVAIPEGPPRPLPLPRIDEARELFAQHVVAESADAANIRRVYLRLALQYHPDKRPEADRSAATQLFQAIAAAYEELTKASDPQAQIGQRVKSPVAAAAELGELQELRRLLLEDPSRATVADDLSVYPLMFAAFGGCVEAAEILLDFGADLHAQNPIKWSVLLYAALGNQAAMVRFLVARGAEVTDHELILAAYTGNPCSLEALLELYEGFAPALRTGESKKTLLHLACEGMCFLRHSARRHADCVELALRWQVPVDVAEPAKQRTCLHDYVGDVRWRTRGFENSAAHMDVLERLCAKGASVTAEDAEGNSAISLASEAGLARVRELLFSYA
mmetsp:Transcript_20671/g.57653  ORF Transcript_20671/g.57653 Transcript_20671/m.57653 type:complete len:335 (-) Transcript_20671:110-1114(-)|eukprot:CAMPEP_0117507404 /NCGR_PEP_ID=MMETSP0784-20121206/26405_1 /TAXON_ID=39447 /ORGANISM="" /LENGTH=334 /DNA_ID=CAMNT_0005302905 /DNA_START=62 /DNA_END=1066 /DNA_ORIENTATION=+